MALSISKIQNEGFTNAQDSIQKLLSQEKETKKSDDGWNHLSCDSCKGTCYNICKSKCEGGCEGTCEGMDRL